MHIASELSDLIFISAFRSVVFDMSEDRCYYAFTPYERSLRPSSPGFGGVQRLQRWSSGDLNLAYDKICWGQQL